MSEPSGFTIEFGTIRIDPKIAENIHKVFAIASDKQMPLEDHFSEEVKNKITLDLQGRNIDACRNSGVSEPSRPYLLREIDWKDILFRLRLRGLPLKELEVFRESQSQEILNWVHRISGEYPIEVKSIKI